MRIFGATKIDFVGKRKKAFLVSMILIIVGFVSLIMPGIKYSIDFAGGTSIELDLTVEGVPDVEVAALRKALKEDGFEDVEIQNVEKYFLIRLNTAENSGERGTKLIESVKRHFPDNIGGNLIRMQEAVGPKIGGELKSKAVWAIFYSLLGIILYIWFRFQFTFGVAAVIALFHDVIITLGILNIIGVEISIGVVAAVLTIIGYSLNDTIVVFDRIREDLKVYRRESYESVINHSINETLSRTIITSLTTFLVVVSLLIFGGKAISDIAVTLLIGVICGTYSSIFVASPIMVEYFNRQLKKKGLKRG
ncbi:MAG: protein translocase subunit SecF [Candidatus Cloacimonadota bacterium]|nr:MAG: protein translocase subunit SecF [Candidatus Cloacimonadota bacterium]